jgi:hypothetical protein
MVKITGIEAVLKDIEKQSKAAFEKRESEVREALIDRLVEATPIDTGEARKGWRVEGKDIVNEVEHIARLNEGSSKQAPEYFVEKTVLSHPGIRPDGIIVKKLAPLE